MALPLLCRGVLSAGLVQSMGVLSAGSVQRMGCWGPA